MIRSLTLLLPLLALACEPTTKGDTPEGLDNDSGGADGDGFLNHRGTAPHRRNRGTAILFHHRLHGPTRIKAVIVAVPILVIRG